MNKIRKFLKTEDGFVFEMFVIFMPVLILLFGLTIDYLSINYIKKETKSSLTYACESAAKVFEPRITDNIVVLKKPDSINKFYEVLMKNFEVDNSLNPISENYVRDKIRIEELVIYDDDTVSMPYYDIDTNKTYEYPTIKAKIWVPINLIFLDKFVGPTEIPVLVVVSSEEYL